MAGVRFDEIQQSILSENENITKATSKSITYTNAFKLKAENKNLFPVKETYRLV